MLKEKLIRRLGRARPMAVGFHGDQQERDQMTRYWGEGGAWASEGASPFPSAHSCEGESEGACHIQSDQKRGETFSKPKNQKVITQGEKTARHAEGHPAAYTESHTIAMATNNQTLAKCEN